MATSKQKKYTIRVTYFRPSGGQGALPGLHETSAGWDGYIYLTCDEGYPWLILPPSGD